MVQPKFSHFFLCKLLGQQLSFIDDLPSLDKELYKNLMFVKTFKQGVDGNLSDLCLTFSITENSLGQKAKEIDLIPNGSQITVTHKNRLIQHISGRNCRIPELIDLITKLLKLIKLGVHSCMLKSIVN